jgi:hypothetical protein
MQTNLKFRTCVLSFLLLVSSLSVFIIAPEPVGAQDGLDDFSLPEDILILYGMHPYVTAGFFEYEGEDDLVIKGDITFNLFYSPTLSSSLLWKDDIIVSIHKLTEDPSSLFGFSLKEIENANKTIKLKPELLGDFSQKLTVTLEDIDMIIQEGDTIVFKVEVVQSGKPIGNLFEKRFGAKLISMIEKVADFLKNAKSEDLINIGEAIVEILNLTEEMGLTPETIRSLVDSLSSSSFVYNSKDYPSNVFLPINNEKNLTLYFNKTIEDELSVNLAYMTEDMANGSTASWPVRLKLFSVDGEAADNLEEWTIWFTCWASYISGGTTPDEEVKKNIVTYYLTSDKKLVTEEPKGTTTSRNKITETPTTWEGIIPPRNKIIKNVTAELYLYFSKILLLRKVTVTVTLYDKTDEVDIASVEKNLDRTKIMELLLRGPESPTVFEFDGAVDKELYYDHEYILKISETGGPKLTLRSTFLLCDSKDYPSSITFNLEDTDHIKITNDLENKKIIAGGTAEYVLNITSKYPEKLNIEVTSKDLDKLEKWEINYPTSIDIKENESIQITVYVSLKDTTLTAYGNKIDLDFNVGGKTGFASKKANVEVSKSAVDFDVDVKKPANQEIKHGTSKTYMFIITNNNTGILPDTYDIDVESEHDWKLELDYKDSDLINVAYDDKFYVNVTAYVPIYTEICSDKITLRITSTESQKYDKDYTEEITVKTIVILPNIFEHIYHFFEGAAKDMGLDEVLGDFGAAFLIFFVIFVILILLILIIIIVKRKYVDIICLERIKEIDPTQEAEFDVQIKNTYKDKLTYVISANKTNSSEGWEVSADTQNVIVQSKESVPVKLFVRPTDLIKKDDWVEVIITARPVEKNKSGKISIITMLKPSKPELKITGVLHWPKVFNKGGKVTTSFILRNTGDVAAHNVSIVLLVNGKEKNKVQDITIPRGGYAEIEIPWVAVKGKNEVNIVVK